MKLLLLIVSAIVVFNVNSHGFAGGHKGRHSLKRDPVLDSPNLPQNLKKLLNDGPSSDNIIRQTWELKKTPLFVPHGTQDQELPDEIAQQIEKEYLKMASNNGSYLEESKGQTKTIRQHAPCREGFNRIGSKCYKKSTDGGRSWQDSKSWCEAQGLVMAGKPDDAITFRAALIKIYGHSRVWLDARGDNTQFRWERNNEAISNTDALWYPSSLGSKVTTRDCLLFLFTDYSQKHPFYSWSCNYPEFTICEYAPCREGFNRIGSKCYKMYTDTTRSWDESKSWCEAEGLIMAGKPDDAITLRATLIEIYGNHKYVWLDARGDNTELRWGRNNEAISNTDDLWWPGSPGTRVTTSDCLLLLSSQYYLDSSPTQPFYPFGCHKQWYTICEYASCPEGFYKIGSKCYKIYTDTRRSWDDSKSKCEAEGLLMAGNPDDAITLRKYLVDNIGNHKYVWLDARGDNTELRWGRNNEAISNTDDLWWPGSPGTRVTTSDCLLLLSSQYYLDSSPTQPFYPFGCHKQWYTICEYPIVDTCVCGTVNRVQLIVGGITTEENEYPWQVALVAQDSNFVNCGGSLINDRWVLTAAHCTGGVATQVLLGNHYINQIDSAEMRVNIKTVVNHPYYNRTTIENDFALVELETPLDLEAVAPHIRPVCLPSAINPSQYEDVEAIVTGWGQNSTYGSLSHVLQEVTLTTMNNSECQRLHGDLHTIVSPMICATKPGQGACYGDSGGPMVRDVGSYFNLIGVVSFGHGGCAHARNPSVFARVTDQIDWITTTSSSGQKCAPPN